MKLRKTLLLCLSMLFSCSSATSEMTSTIGLFDEYKQMQLDVKEDVSSRIYVPKSISNIREIPINQVLLMDGQSFNCRSIYEDEKYSSFMGSLPVNGSIPTISNFTKNNDDVIYYDGLNVYVFDDNYKLQSILNINDNKLKYSAIFTYQNEYYAFNIDNTYGYLYVLNSSFKRIQNYTISINGLVDDENIFVSYINSGIATSTDDLSYLVINNHIFRFDFVNKSLTSDGFVPLDTISFDKEMKAIKKIDTGYLYSSNYKLNCSYETISLSTENYEDVVLNAICHNDDVNLFFNIGFTAKDKYHYFSEYLKISNDEISQYCFSLSSFYLATRIEYKQLLSEVYLSTIEDCYKYENKSFYIEYEELL